MFAPCKNGAAALRHHIHSILINHYSQIRTLTQQDLTFFIQGYICVTNMQIKYKQKMMLHFTLAVHKHLATKHLYTSMCIHLQILVKFMLVSTDFQFPS